MTLLTKPSHADTVDKVSHLSSLPSSSSWSQDLKDVRASCGDRCEVKGRAYLRCILEHGTSPQSIVRPRLWLGRDTQVFYLMFREARDEQWDKITVCAYLGYLELSAEIMGDSVLTQTLLNSFSQHVGKIQNNLHETSKYSLQSFASSIFNSFTSLQWDSWDWRVVTSQQQFLVFPVCLALPSSCVILVFTTACSDCSAACCELYTSLRRRTAFDLIWDICLLSRICKRSQRDSQWHRQSELTNCLQGVSGIRSGTGNGFLHSRSSTLMEMVLG